MNYHELTMSESRDSPQKRKQFLLICTVMAAALVHSVLQAGGLESVVIEDGNFPGGDFVYKETKRDYAASASLEKLVGKTDAGLLAKDYIDRIYTLYLDDPNKMGGRRQRFASGYLVTDKDEMAAGMKENLLSKNEGKKHPSKEDILELGAIELWPRLLYKSSELPAVKAATVQFAHTGGFVSAMIFSLKIVPALRSFAQEHAAPGSPITIISTCSTVDNVCTHYAPLGKGTDFLLGHADTDMYMASMEPEETLNFTSILRSMKKFIPPLRWVLGSDPVEEDDEEEPQVAVPEKVVPVTEEEPVVAEEEEPASSEPVPTTDSASDEL